MCSGKPALAAGLSTTSPTPAILDQTVAVRKFASKSAASAASPGYVKFRTVIKSAASAASLRGGRASGRLDHGLFFAIFGRASGQKIIKISDSVMVLDTEWILAEGRAGLVWHLLTDFHASH